MGVLLEICPGLEAIPNMLESTGHVHRQQHSSAQVLARPPSMSARIGWWSEVDSQVTCYKVERDVHVIRAMGLGAHRLGLLEDTYSR